MAKATKIETLSFLEGRDYEKATHNLRILYFNINVRLKLSSKTKREKVEKFLLDKLKQANKLYQKCINIKIKYGIEKYFDDEPDINKLYGLFIKRYLMAKKDIENYYDLNKQHLSFIERLK